MTGRAVVALLAAAALVAQNETPRPAPAAAPGSAEGVDLGTKAAAQAGADKALAFFVRTQHPNGSWGSAACESQFDAGFSVESYSAWQMAAHCLAVLALQQASETSERRACLDRAVEWLVDARMPLRGSSWDNDAVWAWLYGTVATTALIGDPRFDNDTWRGRLVQRGKEFVAWLEKNQVPTGGFGYYDDPTFSARPKWATSFATSSVLPAISVAMTRGWTTDPHTLERAAAYLKRCRLPSGAYQYDLTPIPRVNGGEHINDVKGSLGRIQVCNWALRAAGDPDITDAVLRQGLQQFFDHHEFLQIARLRPIPHEAYYYNAGYFFFFGHYYCAQVIQLLPPAERESWHRQLRPHLLRTLRDDGSCCDFQNTSYMITAATAFACMSLLAGL